MIEIKDKIVICADNIHSEHASMEEAWQTEPTESCYVIDFETGKVWIPVIDRLIGKQGQLFPGGTVANEHS